MSYHTPTKKSPTGCTMSTPKKIMVDADPKMIQFEEMESFDCSKFESYGDLLSLPVAQYQCVTQIENPIGFSAVAD